MLPSTGSVSLSAAQPSAFDPMSLMNAAGSDAPTDSNQQISKLSAEISDSDKLVVAKKAQYFVAMDIYEKDIAKLEINMSDNNTGLLDAQAKLKNIKDDLVMNVVSGLYEGVYREIQQLTSDLISEFQDMDSDFDPNVLLTNLSPEKGA